MTRSNRRGRFVSRLFAGAHLYSARKKPLVGAQRTIIDIRKTWRHATLGKTLYQAVTTFREDH